MRFFASHGTNTAKVMKPNTTIDRKVVPTNFPWLGEGAKNELSLSLCFHDRTLLICSKIKYRHPNRSKIPAVYFVLKLSPVNIPPSTIHFRFLLLTKYSNETIMHSPKSSTHKSTYAQLNPHETLTPDNRMAGAINVVLGRSNLPANPPTPRSPITPTNHIIGRKLNTGHQT